MVRMMSEEDKEYVYMNWQYKKSYSEGISKKNSDLEITEIHHLQDLEEYSEFADIESWLQGQGGDENCLEIYCDCCDTQDYQTYQDYSPLHRSDSGLIVEQSDQSQQSLQYSDQSQDSSQYSDQSYYNLQECDQFYSLQLRKKSNVIFKEYSNK